MYTPRGFGYSEVGDIEVFADGDDLHLYHLTLPNHDVIQHAVSRDGLRWTELPAALWTGAPGDVDDDMVWTMSVTRSEGTSADGAPFVMLYTALARAEDGLVQRVAHATSYDLIRWDKTGNTAVAESDPRWYESTLAESGAVSFRDPKPVRVGDRWYMVVCARTRDGTLLQRGAAALLVSDDLLHWEHRGPILTPGRYWDLECPQLFTVGGTWYLTAGIMEDGTQRYWQSDSADGPFHVPADGGILAPQGHYAGRVVNWRGQDLYVCWHRPLGHHGPTPVDWATQRNTAGKFVPAPLVLHQRSDGSLACGPFAGFDGYREGAPLSLPAPDDTGWHLETGPGATGTWLTSDDHGDLILEGTLTIDAAAGGFRFRADGETGEGYTVEFRRGYREVALQKLTPTMDKWTGQRRFTYADYQRGMLPAPVGPDRAMPFRLVLSGPYIELSIAGEVVIATLSGARTIGQLGIWAEDGRVTLADATFAPLGSLAANPPAAASERLPVRAGPGS